MMRARRAFLGTSALLFIVAVLFLADAVKSRRSAEAALGAASGQNRALNARLQRAEQRRAAADCIRAELDDVRSRPRANTSSSTVAPPATKQPAATRYLSEIIATDPKLEVLELRRLRAAYASEYADFFQASGRTPAQMEKYLALRLKQSETRMDLDAAARAQGVGGKDAVDSLKQKAKEDFNVALVELLGPDGPRQLLEYERTLPMRNVIMRGLAGAAAVEGIPITAEQGDCLLRAAMNAARATPVTPPYDWVKTVDWNALDQQAALILSPAQFTLFKHSAPPSGFDSRWRIQLNEAIRQAQAADAAKSNATTIPTEPPIR